ncbi:MAG: NAD(P)H-hydrate dehydratase [Hamadaea sp.]|uniref:NAD(P)H-hydrate dehydratase n=1 Tax=Hamadaea sp. TaxID=2024425 RepID=UPI00182F1045|nr:NAD(P)H-hydrate dehydratase [Hamadaea sp.]NUR70971.1 NAD(P)H-hydrate dehydratase [Hamadaea sp.]NUT20082.1 NAD(P)H-hydrate dehydratase [Hamadaea sp.]
MRAAWRAADVRAAEKTLMETLPAGTLMARAAAGLARRCAITLRTRGRIYGSRVLLLVGTGDNGGDALYAGATLAGQGVAVSAWLVDPRRAHVGGLQALLAAGGRVVTDWPAEVDLVVDGMLGIGATGALRGAALDAANRVAELNAPIIAVDVPSGVAVDTGDVLGPAVRADVTVTFGVLKPALVVGPAAPLAGQVELVDIGLTMAAAPAVRLAEQSDIDEWWPHPGPESDKYSRGVVGLATGSASFPGAALLSTAGALAGPTGMVRYAGSAHSIVATLHPSVVVARRVSDSGRVQAWVCGSGLSTDQRAREELRAVLASPLPAVLDADAITMLVDGTHANELRARSAPTVLTPHDGEFNRLAGYAPGADRVGAALTLAAWTRSVVLLKGDRTIVAGPDGEAWVNPTGSPALATAGSGDVLGGLLGSLLAAGLTPVRAAVAAAYLHGLAGRVAGSSGSVTSSDVAVALRGVVPR